jgi:uridine phosphorylase
MELDPKYKMAADNKSCITVHARNGENGIKEIDDKDQSIPVYARNGENGIKEIDGKDQRMTIGNENLKDMKEDVLYHLALSTKTHDLVAMFNDVKFVCIGGSPSRMESFAYFMMDQLKYDLPAGQTLFNITKATDRYAMYKVGPVLALSHGMGIPSVSILLHEVMKLLYHAKCSDVQFFRMGTSGGLGLEPGTVVITEEVVDALFQPHFEVQVLGKVIKRPATLDERLIKRLIGCSRPEDNFKVVTGKTMCTLDFYEGQARLDGAFCDYTENEKMTFLSEAYERGIRNIEMESICFAAMCRQCNVRGAVVCVTLLDRLHGDQVNTPVDIMKLWDKRPAVLVARYICSQLGIQREN